MDIQALGQTVRQPVVERTREVGTVPETEKEEKSAPAARAPVFDEYVPEDPTVKRSAGIYQIIHEDDGTPSVRFDAPDGEVPEKTSPDGKAPAKAAPDKEGPEKASPDKKAPESKAETTTCNTDDVDRELERLREKRETLERQLRQASGDPGKAEELERQLSQVERELSQKDNDAYRRQHAKFS